MTIGELLSESVTSARNREQSTFDDILSDADGRVVLFGAGTVGRKVALALRRFEIEALAFADNDPMLAGGLVENIPVLSLATAAARWGDTAVFIVTILLPAEGGITARISELKRLGCKNITTFLTVGWRYEGILPHFALDRPSRTLTHAGSLANVSNLWCDALSRDTYRSALELRLRGSISDFRPPIPDQYFPLDILVPSALEVFIDGGAYDGDTLRAAPWPLSTVLAIEPDPRNVDRLRAHTGAKIELHEVLLGRAPGTARFNGFGTMASARSDGGNMEVRIATLDDITKNHRPTFLKLDVEGDELAALQGGLGMLSRDQPVVAVCVYHRPEDLWAIPLFLNTTLPSHCLFLRAHAWDGFELVAYAVPKVRCRL